MAPSSQMQLIYAIVLLTVAAAQIPSECERGVKRAHPTQENAFQILSRNGWRHQWLDGECPAPFVYDQAVCDCVETPTVVAPPASAFPQSQRPWSQPADDWSIPPAAPHQQQRPQQQRRNQPPPPPQQQQQSRRTQPPQRPKGQPPQQPLQNYPPQSQPPQFHSSFPPSETEPPVDENECRFHRPNTDPSKYDRLSDRGWSTEDCNWPIYLGLVWDQVHCRCDWGDDVPEVRRNSLVTTVTQACIVMLNMTFDRFIAEESNSHWLKRGNEDGAQILPEPGSHGQCALFRDSTVSIPFFKSNTLGSLFRLTFSFRECSGEDPDREIVLLHNGCADIRTPPTIALGYRPRTRVFMMEFGTTNDIATSREECQVNSERENRWIDVDIRYQEGYLEVLINGEVCIGSSQFSGDVKTTDCALTLPGEDMCVYMDELLITRGCRA